MFRNWRHHEKTILAASLAVAAGATTVQAQEDCTFYTVQPGDSLSAITRTAYGNTSFQALWDANRTVVGPNPNRIRVGMQLRLPCADGTLPAREHTTTASAEPFAPDETPLTIRLVTGTGYAPFTDKGMEGRGIYTQLVRAAMQTMEPDLTTSITFVNDWGSHVETPLPAVAFDGAFPWLVTNCGADPATLTENSRFRCDEFIHSEPFYEIVNSLTVPSGSPLATTESYEDFHGLRICLPDGYTDAPLARGGLEEGIVTLVRPVDPNDCVRFMAAGELDAVSLEQRQDDDIIERLGFSGQFVSNPNLTVANTLSVFISKDHPNGEVVMAQLNKGLSSIRDSGVWFTNVREGFRDFCAESN